MGAAHARSPSLEQRVSSLLAALPTESMRSQPCSGRSRVAARSSTRCIDVVQARLFGIHARTNKLERRSFIIWSGAR